MISRKFNYDQAFAFMRIISILSDSNEFIKWVKKFHNMDQRSDFLEGYRLILLTSVKCFIESILMYDPFKLKDDQILERASFRGITLDDIPNTCEKTIFIKNVWNMTKDIRKAKTWEDIHNEKSLHKLVTFFEEILGNKLAPTTKPRMTESLTSISEFYAYIYLIDTSHGFPKGAIVSIFEDIRSYEYLDKAFIGYSYALQFLWFILLGEDKFRKSCLIDLHRSTEVNLRDESEHPSIDLSEHLEFIPVEESESEKEQQRKRNEVSNKWYSIDQFFSKVRSEIIRPMELELHVNFGGIENGLLKMNRGKNLPNFLLSTDIPDASFVGKTDEKSIKKKIDCDLLWYPFSVLDSSLTFSFNGSFAFISMLKGYVQWLSEEFLKGKILIKIFKHPVIHQSGNDYSFGILVGVYGAISDSSGWLVFLDCVTDYSGSGGHEFELCKKEIKKQIENGKILLQEQTIDKQVFKKYLSGENIHTLDKFSMSEILHDATDIVAKSKGKFFEYLFFRWLVDAVEYDQIKCDIYIDKEQVDCYFISGKKIEIFECKLQVHEGDNTVKQICNKIRAIENTFPSYEITSNLVVYESTTEDRKAEFEKAGIRVIHNFKNAILKDRSFDGIRKEILGILGSNMKNEYEYY